MAEELVPHTDTIVPAIEALRAGPGGAAALREAARVMDSTGETFASAFASAL